VQLRLRQRDPPARPRDRDHDCGRRVDRTSGPLALAANGDLYYGSIPNAFPPPPTAILSWTHVQITSGIVQDETTAATFIPGIVVPSSMRFDPVYGHLVVAEPVFGGTSGLFEYDRQARSSRTSSRAPNTSPASSSCARTGGLLPGVPADGVKLVYRGTTTGP